MAKQEIQHPNWVFTVQFGGVGQPGISDLDSVLKLLQDKSTYIVMGKERAPTTGQQHIQGYVELKKKARRTELVKLLACFWEPAKGSGEQNREYCTKEGDYFEYGEFKEADPGERERNRWAVARLQATRGEDVEDSQIFICHYNSIRAIKRDYMNKPADADDVTGVWIYGPAGVGKSRKARLDFPNAYLKMCNKWWDGYQGEDYAIIDDFDKSHSVLGHHLKIWADRYAFIGEVKGTACTLRPKKVIVTSQYSIDEIWEDAETREALHRRFKVIHLGEFPVRKVAATVSTFVPPTPERKVIVLDEETDDEDENCENQDFVPVPPGNPYSTPHPKKSVKLTESYSSTKDSRSVLSDFTNSFTQRIPTTSSQ